MHNSVLIIVVVIVVVIVIVFVIKTKTKRAITSACSLMISRYFRSRGLSQAVWDGDKQKNRFYGSHAEQDLRTS